jgi:RNA polymerase sigma-70 factor (ECF subfamily)
MKADGPLTDEELAKRAAEGSEAHFNALVDRYTPLMYRTALGITGVAEEAEEIVQETFIKLFRNLDRFSPEKASFKTWLLTITRNQSINSLNSLKRKAARFFSEARVDEYGPATEGDFPLSSQRDAESVMTVKQEYARVEKALKHLPERQRTALRLRSIENLSYGEIAHIMKTSTSSVESLIFRARRRLLELLED